MMKLHRLLRRKYWDRERALEVESHLQHEIDDNVARGMTAGEARRHAYLKFGNPTRIREEIRQMNSLLMLESLWRDLKYAMRQMWVSPGFAIIVILTMALGAGVNTAIFSVFDQVLLRIMPIHQAQQLVLLHEHSRYETGGLNAYGGGNDLYFSYPAYEALRKNRVLSGLAASALAPVTIVTSARAENGSMQFVSGNYFAVMDLQPVIGRLLTPEDDRPHAANPVVVLSEAYWRAHLGADPSILNHTLVLNGTPVTVVGIVRNRGLMRASPVDLFVPIALQNRLAPVHGDALTTPLYRWLNLVGRLAPGVTRVQAETQLNLLWWNWRRSTLSLEKNNIPNKKGWLETHLAVASGAKGISLLGDAFGKPVEALQIMALVVLLIVCGNIANLLLARAARRHSELAMRAALGAGRSRLFQQVVVEGALLGFIGAVAGLLLGVLTLKLLLHATPDSDILHFALSGGLNWKIVAFSAAIALVTSIVFSLAPAILSARIDFLHALHAQSSSVTSGASGIRSFLVSVQIALSLGLLICATVFACNLYRLRHIDPGFATTHVLTFEVDAVQQGRTYAEANREYGAIATRVRHLPGVRSVVYAQNGFLNGSEDGGNISIAGYANPSGKPIMVERDTVSPGFFSAMQVPLLAGREFTIADTEPNQKVAIVDRAFVNDYYGGDIQKAIGGVIDPFGDGRPDTRIIGVIPTLRATKLTKASWAPFVYLPWGDRPLGSDVRQHPANFYIRTTGDPSVLAVDVRQIVHGIDKDLPVGGLETMHEHLDNLIFDSRLITILSIAMGALALTLAAIGMYGVLTFSVGQRTREIGIRMAFGADWKAISALVVRQVMWHVGAGVVFGSILGCLGTELLMHRDSSLFVGHAPFWLVGLAAWVLLSAIAVAVFLPARRAATVDPMKALRTE